MPGPSSPDLLLIATGNRHKLAEIRAILADLPVEVAGLELIASDLQVEETGETFAENAEIKARAVAEHVARLDPGKRPRWVLADDSGLEVEALGGAPGVRSARYAGEHASYAENNRKLLAALEGVPEERRAARFVCSIACVEVAPAPSIPARVSIRCEGAAPGRIAVAESGRGGFGYDPIFIDRTTGKAFAELSPAEKNAISHRGRALREFRERFLDLLWSRGEQ